MMVPGHLAFGSLGTSIQRSSSWLVGVGIGGQLTYLHLRERLPHPSEQSWVWGPSWPPWRSVGEVGAAEWPQSSGGGRLRFSRACTPSQQPGVPEDHNAHVWSSAPYSLRREVFSDTQAGVFSQSPLAAPRDEWSGKIYKKKKKK